MRFAQTSFSRKWFAISCVAFLLAGSRAAEGQTEDQLAARFKRVPAFEIRAGVDVFPTFAADGNVCRIVVEKRKYLDPRNADFGITIPSELANQLIDELVPPSERGKPLSPYLSGDSYVGGGASFIKQDYENVSVGSYGSTENGQFHGVSVIVITWPKRTCPASK